MFQDQSRPDEAGFKAAK